MACSSRQGTACFIEFINEECGVRITQRDWHGVRMLAEVEHGQRLTRARASQKNTDDIVDYLERQVASGDGDGIERLRAAVAADNPTEGTLRAVSYLAVNGVHETLAKVRGEKKPEREADSYAAVVRDGNTTFVQTYDSAATMAHALRGFSPAAYSVTQTKDGVTSEVSQSDTAILIRQGWRDHQEQSKVVPDYIVYSAAVESMVDGVPQTFVHHSTDPAQVRGFVRAFPYGSKVTVYEERKGSTVAQPDKQTYENVELSANEVEAFMAEPDED